MRADFKIREYFDSWWKLISSWNKFSQLSVHWIYTKILNQIVKYIHMLNCHNYWIVTFHMILFELCEIEMKQNLNMILKKILVFNRISWLHQINGVNYSHFPCWRSCRDPICVSLFDLWLWTINLQHVLEKKNMDKFSSISLFFNLWVWSNILCKGWMGSFAYTDEIVSYWYWHCYSSGVLDLEVYWSLASSCFFLFELRIWSGGP